MLKVLILRSKLEAKKDQLNQLRAKDADFETRSAELEAAINEMTAETPEEDRAVVEEQVETFAADKEKHENDKKALETEIAGIEDEIRAEEEAQRKIEKPVETREKGGVETMETRKFFNLNAQERDAFFAREDVKEFLLRTRDIMTQKRTVSGAELTIPTVMLDLIKENILKYSKLIDKVRVVAVEGKARQTIMGTIPEAIWTEACATLNEIDIQFNQVEVDGYKVGGFVAVCNAVLEDSDIALATELISALGQAIGFALDKAILFGTGAKMPIGIATRLAQTVKPDNYQANNIPWVDLHTTNIKKIDATKTGAEFYADLITAAAAAKSTYSRGVKFWAMNETTYSALMAKSVAANANGAFVAGVNGTLPIIGGDIVVLPFIPDNDIIGGYGDLYLLAERAGTTLAQSTEYKFVEDQTVFKGTARYDGLPVIPEGFVIINLNNEAPITSQTFTPDTANDATLKALAVGSATLSPVFAANKYAYKVTASGTTGAVKVETNADDVDKLVIKYNGSKIENGDTITFVTGTKDLTVAVTKGAATLTYTVAITKA